MTESDRLYALAAWIRQPGNINPQDAVDECARLLENNARMQAPDVWSRFLAVRAELIAEWRAEGTSCYEIAQTLSMDVGQVWLINFERENGPAPADVRAAVERTKRHGPHPRPTVVCLCGSTRFKREFIDANFRETMAGKIVLSVGFFSHSDDEGRTPTVEEKERLDWLHKRKIDVADEILVLNVGGYIGSSTQSEIEHAVATNKRVRYLE